jgi:hypothetical protein
MGRIARLEAKAAPPSSGKHLVFKVEAPHGMPVAEIVTFLRGRGHAIHDEDDVFVMNLKSYSIPAGKPPRDLAPTILTEEDRAAAPAGGIWPERLVHFTFVLDSPRDLQ